MDSVSHTWLNNQIINVLQNPWFMRPVKRYQPSHEHHHIRMHKIKVFIRPIHTRTPLQQLGAAQYVPWAQEALIS